MTHAKLNRRSGYRQWDGEYSIFYEGNIQKRIILLKWLIDNDTDKEFRNYVLILIVLFKK